MRNIVFVLVVFCLFACNGKQKDMKMDFVEIWSYEATNSPKLISNIFLFYREFDEFHFMCAALLLPNCRDAFLRLSQLPSLRDWQFYSAILLAETQECVSTTFRRIHIIYRTLSDPTPQTAP